MPEQTVTRPEVGTREVTIHIPDAVADLFKPETTRQAGATAAQVARNAGNSARDVAASAIAQATPIVERVGASTAMTAGKAAVKGAQLAEAARQAGDTVATRTREEWLPAARAGIDQARPAVAQTLQTTATRAGQMAAAAGAGVQLGASAAAEGARQSTRSALSAIGSALSQLFSLMFWLSVVAWLLIRIFFPRPEQRQRLYERVRRYTGM